MQHNLSMEVAKLRYTIPLWSEALQLSHVKGKVDPVSLAIYHASWWVIKPLVACQAITKLRYGDAVLLDYTVFQTMSSWVTRQGKTGRQIRVDLSEIYKVFSPAAIVASTPLSIVGYDSFVYNLNSAIKRAGVPGIAGVMDKSHYFRHLYASWRESQGDTVAKIRKVLGHTHKESIQSYIHDWNYFSRSI